MAFFQVVAVGIDLVRAWVGPLPSPICNFSILLKGILSHGFIFLMLGIFIMRYLFVCRWKYLKAVEDDFIARFTLFVSLGFGLGLQLVKLVGPGKVPHNLVSQLSHYKTLKKIDALICLSLQLICRGTFTPSIERLEKHFHLEIPFVLLAFISCVFLGTKVEMQRYRNGQDALKKLQISNQSITNQDSIIGNLSIMTFYVCCVVGLAIMGK